MEIEIVTRVCIDYKTNNSESKDVKKYIMCKKLNELSGMTPANILEKYPTDPDTYAVDMRDIMKKIGVSVITYDFSSISARNKKNVIGAILLSGDKLAVFISNKLSQAEQRFVLAHELGHCCKHASTLETQKIEFACDLESKDCHEHEADLFADELLLPEKEFREVCAKFTGNKDIPLLAEIFCVPSACIRRRLASLDIN